MNLEFAFFPFPISLRFQKPTPQNACELYPFFPFSPVNDWEKVSPNEGRTVIRSVRTLVFLRATSWKKVSGGAGFPACSSRRGWADWKPAPQGSLRRGQPPNLGIKDFLKNGRGRKVLSNAAPRARGYRQNDFGAE